MPTYEYMCKYCRHAFDALQSITAKRLRKCRECGRNGLHRLISGGAGILFKGSGFYETDYGRGSHSKLNSTGSGDKKEKPAGETPTSSKRDDASD